MEIKVSGRHIEITESLREYATGKVGKLPRYYDRVQSIEVVANKTADDHEVEILVNVERSEPFVARSAGTDLYKCIDETVNKMERQLTDHKSKLRNRKHPA